MALNLHKSEVVFMLKLELHLFLNLVMQKYAYMSCIGFSLQECKTCMCVQPTPILEL